MNLRTLVAVIAAGLLPAAAPAEAAVIATLTATPNQVQAGGSVTLDATLVAQPDPGFIASILQGIVVTIDSGAGASQAFSLDAEQSTQEFTGTFVYPTSGSFTASISGTLSEREAFVEQVQVGVFCGLFGCFPIFQPEIFFEAFVVPINATTPVVVTAAVPEPTSLALMGAGLMGLAIIRRRKRA
jgi:hypothetical protein